MIVAEVIQAQWRADARLLALVPPARVFTGLAAGEPALPYVVVRREAGSAPQWTSRRRVDAETWELVVWAGSHAAAAEILSAVAGRFDRRTVELAGDETLDFTRREGWVEPAENGRWRGVARYRVRHLQNIIS